MFARKIGLRINPFAAAAALVVAATGPVPNPHRGAWGWRGYIVPKSVANGAGLSTSGKYKPHQGYQECARRARRHV